MYGIRISSFRREAGTEPVTRAVPGPSVELAEFAGRLPGRREEPDA